MSFFEELKNRHVFRVGATYAIVAWLLEQAVDMGFGYKAWLINDPSLKPLQDEPRLKTLLERLD